MFVDNKKNVPFLCIFHAFRWKSLLERLCLLENISLELVIGESTHLESQITGPTYTPIDGFPLFPEAVIAGLDYWNGLLEWTTGMDFLFFPQLKS